MDRVPVTQLLARPRLGLDVALPTLAADCARVFVRVHEAAALAGLAFPPWATLAGQAAADHVPVTQLPARHSPLTLTGTPRDYSRLDVALQTPAAGAQVFVHVYQAPALADGTPVLVTGVEVHGREWGMLVDEESSLEGCLHRSITWYWPGQRPRARLQQTLSMGLTSCSASEVLALVDSMGALWEGYSEKSPIDFAEALCCSLGVARLPAWVAQGHLVSSPRQAPAARASEGVFLRIYDLGNTFLSRLHNSVLKSFGAFHTGVEVYGHEWSFGNASNTWATGITSCMPGCNPDHSFRETLVMGVTHCSSAEVVRILESMTFEWRGCSYHALKRNCHDFAAAFCFRLGVGTLPPWINELATSLAAAMDGEADQPGAPAEQESSLFLRPCQPLADARFRTASGDVAKYLR